MSRNLGIVLTALCVALGLGSTANASTNLLLNKPWTSNKDSANDPGDSGYLPYNPAIGVYHGPLVYTDGSTTTWDYQTVNSVITYDLGSMVTGLSTVGVATNGAAGSRDNPEFITLNFSNDNFATAPIATAHIPLGDTTADQDVSFLSVTARYVQIVMPPAGLPNFYNDGLSSDYILPAEFELYAPEPASLSMLIAGGLLILRRRRGNARV